MATVIVGLALAGCGSSSKSSSPTPLKLSIGEAGKQASFKVPKSAKGGLVAVELRNDGKAPHGVQFIQYTGNHTAKQALQAIGGNSEKTPSWLKAAGGIGAVVGGQSGTATLNLAAGNYVLVDAAALSGPSEGPPATTQMKIASGTSASLPSTPATVTANHTGKDKYAWNISGLKAGKNQVTFNSKGNDALHLIIAVPVKGNKVPPLSTIEKDLASNGPPPAFVEPQGQQSTAVLDGGQSQTTTLDLKAGKYIFFCPLHDRDGGKAHFEEGLLKVATVK
jgi:hypothetical protein